MYDVLSASMSIYNLSAVPTEVREGAGYPGAVVSDGCVLPCVCWRLNLDLQQGQREEKCSELLSHRSGCESCYYQETGFCYVA